MQTNMDKNKGKGEAQVRNKRKWDGERFVWKGRES